MVIGIMVIMNTAAGLSTDWSGDTGTGVVAIRDAISVARFLAALV